MDGVTVVTHPLVQHKLTLMRDKETSTRGFRQLLRETATLLCYEVTRDLTLTTKRIETPLVTMDAPILEGKKLVPDLPEAREEFDEAGRCPQAIDDADRRASLPARTIPIQQPRLSEYPVPHRHQCAAG